MAGRACQTRKTTSRAARTRTRAPDSQHSPRNRESPTWEYRAKNDSRGFPRGSGAVASGVWPKGEVILYGPWAPDRGPGPEDRPAFGRPHFRSPTRIGRLLECHGIEFLVHQLGDPFGE